MAGEAAGRRRRAAGWAGYPAGRGCLMGCRAAAWRNVQLGGPPVGWPDDHPPINNALGGGGSPIALVHFRCVMHGSYFVLCVELCLSSRWMFVCLVVRTCLSSHRHFVCLVCSFRYWFLAASRLVARFAGVARFARWAGPSGPQ